jgi:hypothetical protein
MFISLYPSVPFPNLEPNDRYQRNLARILCKQRPLQHCNLQFPAAYYNNSISASRTSEVEATIVTLNVCVMSYV